MYRSKKKSLIMTVLITIAFGLTIQISGSAQQKGVPIDAISKGNGKVLTRVYDNQTNAGVAGVEFTITETTTGKIVAVVTSNQAGEADIEIPIGNYEVKQTKGPSNYVLNKVPQTFYLGDGVRMRTTFKISSDSGGVVIKVYDKNTDMPIEGAVFALTDLNNQVLTKLTTNKAGVASIDYRAGEYQVKQIKASTGYSLYTGIQPITITNKLVLTLTIQNER